MRYAFALTLTLLTAGCQRDLPGAASQAQPSASAMAPPADSPAAASAPVAAGSAAAAPTPAATANAEVRARAAAAAAATVAEAAGSGAPDAAAGAAEGGLHPADPCYGLAGTALEDCLGMDRVAEDPAAADFRARQAQRDRDLLEQDAAQAAAGAADDSLRDQAPPFEPDSPPYDQAPPQDQDLPPPEPALDDEPPPPDDYNG